MSTEHSQVTDKSRLDDEVIVRKITDPSSWVTTYISNLQTAFNEKPVEPFLEYPARKFHPEGALQGPAPQYSYSSHNRDIFAAVEAVSTPVYHD